jgi:hypothetical protein
MFALDFATQAQQMKAISGQPDYALSSVHAVTIVSIPARCGRQARTEVPARPGRYGAFRAGAPTASLGEGGGGDEPQLQGTTGPGFD